MKYYRKRYRKNRNIDIILLLVVFLAMLYRHKNETNYQWNQNMITLPWFIIRKYALEIMIPLIACVILVQFIKCLNKYLQARKKRNTYIKSRIHEIDHMDGFIFEELLKAHFEKAGYKVTLTKKTGDKGGDLVLDKGNERTIVQAKRYQAKLSLKPIQEVCAAKASYKATKAMVITNSFYTKGARELAADNHIELWDRNDLIEKFKIKE